MSIYTASILWRKRDVYRYKRNEATPCGCQKTYPDYKMEIVRQFENGETVISEFIIRGTHKGEFKGITPTDKIIEMTGNGLIKLVHRKTSTSLH